MRYAILMLAAALITGGCGGGLGSGEGRGKWKHVKVMTRNVYYGADLGDAITAVMSEDPMAIIGAVSAVHAQLEATNFRARARALAQEIVDVRPDLIGVQEAALWRSQFPSDTFTAEPTAATEVHLDLLAILLEELETLGHVYDVVVELETIDAELPRMRADGELEDLRLTDREVILARRDADLTLTNTDSAWFDNIVVLPNGLPIPQGWVSVEVTEGDDTFKFISTHLEADIVDLRVAQASELLAGPADTVLPTILVGDFNSDAHPGAVDSPAFDLLVDGGFARTAPEASDDGTCCQDDILGVGDPATMAQQIDLILVRDTETFEFVPTTYEVAGPTLADVDYTLWSSDHAGVSVKLWWKPEEAAAE